MTNLLSFLFSFWFGSFSPFFELLSISFTNGTNEITLHSTVQNLEENSSLKNAKQNIEKGELLFIQNCTACHLGRNNLIIPEKDLKKDTLEANGMNTVEAITYQIKNGKNGMPAFGGRLSEQDIHKIAKYLINN